MFEKIAQLMGISKREQENSAEHCVLVVDDNQTDLAIIRKTVEKMGNRVLVAENGKIGFEVAKTERPDLILSDCCMPELGGIAMCKQLKEDEETRRIPIVFLTGVDTPSTVIECFDMDIQNYMRKPIKPKLLSAQIRAIFEEYQPA